MHLSDLMTVFAPLPADALLVVGGLLRGRPVEAGPRGTPGGHG
jgi:membrane protein DedA with SNARE-associated domain